MLHDTWQSRLKEFEATLSNSPKDPTALEVSHGCYFCSAHLRVSRYIWKDFQGAAVTLAELGDYAKAASLLDDLTKVNNVLPMDIFWNLPIICCINHAVWSLNNWTDFFFPCLFKEKPNDADVFRLLGEVEYEVKDYERSVAAYKSSAMVSLVNIFKHFSRWMS